MMRPSTEQQVVRVTTAVVTGLIGLALFLGGGFFLWTEMAHPPAHNAHVFTFAGIAVFGALIIRPDPIFAVLRQTLIIVGPYIPVIGPRANSSPNPAQKSDPNG